MMFKWLRWFKASDALAAVGSITKKEDDCPYSIQRDHYKRHVDWYEKIKEEDRDNFEKQNALQKKYDAANLGTKSKAWQGSYDKYFESCHPRYGENKSYYKTYDDLCKSYCNNSKNVL